ncbi:MAG: 50S ribosomal protein L21 [Candidatus Omnitrophica bacterium]|nr:50S ribosomal protein L21 [Candidatus Omnitrophota bacterium]
MYAIVRIGGKQYWVKENEIIETEKQNIEKGKTLTIKDVLFFSGDDGRIEVGRPLLKNVKVVAESLGNFRGEKIIAYKYRRRKSSSHTKKGHRQNLTRLLIKEIKIT